MAGGYNMAGVIYRGVMRRKQDEIADLRLDLESMRASLKRWRRAARASWIAAAAVAVAWLLFR